MCVIMVSMLEGKRPTKEMAERGWEKNSHGGGFAYRDTDTATGKTVVRWEKGLSKDDMIEGCKSLPIPFVAHFRHASSGGKQPELCHPFEVSLTTGTGLEGITEGGVLFHNGDWGEWRGVMLNTAIRSGNPIPVGKWSDTRAMAWLAAIYGPNIMDVIDQKGILFTPDQIEFFAGSGWVEINEVWCSNQLFWGGVRTVMCHESNCSERAGLDADGRCSRHRKRFPVDPTLLPDDEAEEVEVNRALIRMHDHDKTKIIGSAPQAKKRAGAGGGQQPAPFPVEILALIEIGYKDQALMVAETMHVEHPEKLSKNLLKRIRKELTGNTLTPTFAASIPPETEKTETVH